MSDPGTELAEHAQLAQRFLTGNHMRDALREVSQVAHDLHEFDDKAESQLHEIIKLLDGHGIFRKSLTKDIKDLAKSLDDVHLALEEVEAYKKKGRPDAEIHEYIDKVADALKDLKEQRLDLLKHMKLEWEHVVLFHGYLDSYTGQNVQETIHQFIQRIHVMIKRQGYKARSLGDDIDKVVDSLDATVTGILKVLEIIKKELYQNLQPALKELKRLSDEVQAEEAAADAVRKGLSSSQRVMQILEVAQREQLLVKRIAEDRKNALRRIKEVAASLRKEYAILSSDAKAEERNFEYLLDFLRLQARRTNRRVRQYQETH